MEKLDDTISRQEVINLITDAEDIMTFTAIGILRSRIRKLPSVQPERPKGHWIVWGGMDIPENHGRHICSLCREFAPIRYEKPLIKEYLSDFCPNCGADMRGEQDV